MPESTQTECTQQVEILESAGTLFKNVTRELYWASQSAEEGDDTRTETHLDRAMQYKDQAQQLLNQL